MSDPLLGMHRRVFEQGQETIAKQVEVELMEKQAALLTRMADAAGEAIDAANRLGADGDPYKQRIARVLKAGIERSIERVTEISGEQGMQGEAVGALPDTPFSGDSVPSGMRSPSELPPRPALTQDSGAEPPRRGPGRPKKQPSPGAS